MYIFVKRLIELGQTEGLEHKVDVFYANGKLTEDEYQELLGLLSE